MTILAIYLIIGLASLLFLMRSREFPDLVSAAFVVLAWPAVPFVLWQQRYV